MPEPRASLAPEVDVVCVACGKAVADEICGPDELAAQMLAARAFHRARLSRRSRAALEERASFTHDYPTRLLACCSCGLLYRSPRPTTESVLEAYACERYAAERLPQMIASQRALFAPKARELARSLGSGARVLEVGSFVGGFLRAAREVGLDAVGVDPSESLSELCRRSGLRVECSTLEEFSAQSSEEPFDAITVWNTFDQLPRPRVLLAAVRRVLRPGGLVVLRVPHGECFRRLATCKPLPLRALAWNNLLGFPYLHGYGLKSLDELASGFGLTLVRAVGDTLGAVADRSYARWARLEEQAVKVAQRARFARDLGYAPWLDVRFRDTRPTAASPTPRSVVRPGSGAEPANVG
jgi:SAM-dependent methyltransferase